jgi:hypothetical protein
MSDLTSEELDRLYEGSKDDCCIIVGSEVRQMIGMIRRSKDAVFQAKVEAAYILAAEISKSKQLAARIEQLEAALRACVQYHVQNAADCRAIAAVNRDNDLGSDSETHAIDHDIAAEDIGDIARAALDK